MLVGALVIASACAAEPVIPSWAFAVDPAESPAAPGDDLPHRVPGSSSTFTIAAYVASLEP